MVRGFTVILLLAMLGLSIILFFYVFQLYKKGHFNLKESKNDYPSVSFSQEENAELGAIQTVLSKYQGSKLLSATSSLSTGEGIWNVSERGILNTPDPVLSPNEFDSGLIVQTTNGIKNFIIILNKRRISEYGSGPVVVVSKTFIKIYYGLLKSAVEKLNKGLAFNNFSEAEQSAYLLANPRKGADILKEEIYLKSFDIVLRFTLDQNKNLYQEIKSICDEAKHRNVKNYCYLRIARGFVDEFNCDVIDSDFAFNKYECFSIKAFDTQNKAFCEFAGPKKNSCEKSIFSVE